MQASRSTRRSAIAAVILATAGTSVCAAAPILTTSAHVGPWRFVPPGPPNQSQAFTDWNANAIQGLMQGDASVGNPATDPAAYYPVTQINRADVFDSSTNSPTFISWRGSASPTAPFNTAYGNGLIFSLRIVDATTPFKLSNLDNVTTSNDPANSFGFGTHLSANRNYANTRVGINYGPDHIKGTADDIIYQNGESGSLPVNELDYSGVGVAQDVLDPTFNVTPGTNQQNLDRSVAAFYQMNPLTQISNTFMLKDDAGALLGQATAGVSVTPEPASLSLLALGVTGLLSRRRRITSV